MRGRSRSSRRASSDETSTGSRAGGSSEPSCVERLDHGLDAPRIRLDALGELAAELGVVEARREHRGVGADADERVADLVRDGGGEAAEGGVVGVGRLVPVRRSAGTADLRGVLGRPRLDGLRSPPARCALRRRTAAPLAGLYLRA